MYKRFHNHVSMYMIEISGSSLQYVLTVYRRQIIGMKET